MTAGTILLTMPSQVMFSKSIRRTFNCKLTIPSLAAQLAWSEAADLASLPDTPAPPMPGHAELEGPAPSALLPESSSMSCRPDKQSAPVLMCTAQAVCMEEGRQWPQITVGHGILYKRCVLREDLGSGWHARLQRAQMLAWHQLQLLSRPGAV